MQPSSPSFIAGDPSLAGAQRPAPTSLGAGRPLFVDPRSDGQIAAFRDAGGRMLFENTTSAGISADEVGKTGAQIHDGPAVRFARTLTFHDVRTLDRTEFVDLARAFEHEERETVDAIEAELRGADEAAPSYLDVAEMERRERDETFGGETVVGHLACLAAGGIFGLVAGVALGWVFL